MINKLKDNLKRYEADTGRELCIFVYHNGSELLQKYNAEYDLIFPDIKMD